MNSSEIFLLQELVDKIELKQKQIKSLCNFHIKLIAEQQINRLASLPYNTNGWEKIGDTWYYFDSEGWMKTG